VLGGILKLTSITLTIALVRTEFFCLTVQAFKVSRYCNTKCLGSWWNKSEQKFDKNYKIIGKHVHTKCRDPLVPIIKGIGRCPREEQQPHKHTTADCITEKPIPAKSMTITYPGE